MTKRQVKEVAAVQERWREGGLVDKEYFKELEELLVPEEDIQEEPASQQEAMETEEEVKEVKVEVKEEVKEDLKEGTEEKVKSKNNGPKFGKTDEEYEAKVEAGGDTPARRSSSRKPKNQPSVMDMFKKKAGGQEKRKSSAGEEVPEKRLKGEEEAEGERSKVVVAKEPRPSIERCKTCRQLVDSPDTMAYLGHPDGAVEEFIGISDQRLSLFEDGGYEEGLPQYKITGYTVYDKEGHVAPFDTGIIDKNKFLYFSGHLKHLICEDPSTEDGVPVFDCGPINAWSNAGFDGGEKALTIFSTSYAEYYLMEPSEVYAPFNRVVEEKVFLTKHVIEFLQRSRDVENRPDVEYEDLLNYLSTVVPPEGLQQLTDEVLLRHADFVVNQVFSYEEAGDEDEVELVKMPAMKDIIKLAGVKLGVRKQLRIKKKQKQMPKWSAACVTPLVRGVFDAIFAEQMADEAEGEKKGGKKRSKRCGMCDHCLRKECGVCKNCKNMTKFGGNGKAKQACEQRKCEKVETPEDEAEEEVEEPETLLSPDAKSKEKKDAKKVHKEVEWRGEGVVEGRRTYYTGALLDGELEVALGDTVLISPSDPSIPLYVATVSKLYDGRDGPTVHVIWFSRGTDTMFGDAADPTQLFLIDDCEDQPLLSVYRKCTVEMLAEPRMEEWRQLGGSDPGKEKTDDGITFWCSFWYDGATRFEYRQPLPPRPEGVPAAVHCAMCGVVAAREAWDEPQLVGEPVDGCYSSLTWRGAAVRPGDALYLKPGSARLKIRQKEKKEVERIEQEANVDEELFPEYYRKRGYVKGNNYNTPDPFQVCVVKQIRQEGGTVRLRVQLFYRPEDTHLGPAAAERAYNNLLYWSEEEQLVDFAAARGRLAVSFFDLATDAAVLERWGEEGPNRFFFQQWYNADEKQFDEPPPSAQRIGQQGKGGKGKSSAPKKEEKVAASEGAAVGAEFPAVPQRLACLDIFSGCGGLSAGLHQAGVADSKWAVEIFEPAAQAFKLNNPECTVFSDDCNLLLTNAITGVKTNERGQVIPLRGQVDLLCGGPPCQGFSGMNRFNHREYSQFKNSLVSTYLSYCEYYRPR